MPTPSKAARGQSLSRRDHEAVRIPPLETLLRRGPRGWLGSLLVDLCRVYRNASHRHTGDEMKPPRRRPLTPAQMREAADLRNRIQTLKAAKLEASATELRRKLRALLGGYEPEH